MYSTVLNLRSSPAIAKAIAPILTAIVLLLLLPPSLGAWQQRVEYTMRVRLLAESHSISGYQRLVYHNNSPDTIRGLFYHLFFNAIRPESFMDRRDRSIPDGRGMNINDIPPPYQGNVMIDSLKQNGRTLLEWGIDGTILRALLNEPLPPGDSTVLELGWLSQIPLLTRRSGWMSGEGVEYSMAQWYPKLAEYDANGWHPDEYVAAEFYGVYGSFDVELILPERYMVGATGTLLNAEEVGCGYQHSAIDTMILYPLRTTDSSTGTKSAPERRWHFRAENVHDFTWVADPEYFHQITHADGVTVHILAKRSYWRWWTEAADVTKRLMTYYNKRFGRYAWPEFTVAQGGDGGMEYPGMTIITGYRTPESLAGVIAHELAHQWFYGMVGNNETQEAWLDEGFASYLANEATRDLPGMGSKENPNTGLARIVYPWFRSPWQYSERCYRLALGGYDQPLNTFADRYPDQATAQLVYNKGEAVLRMLQYMLGDSLFDAGIRHYVEKWKFRHPSGRDFERSMEEVAGLRLDWYFNQWIGSTRECDYSFDALASRPAPRSLESDDTGWRTTIELSRRGDAIMPLDITLTYDDGTHATATIPVENWHKPGVAFHLPRWDWLERSYRADFTTPRRVISATIDTSMILLDLDRTNNHQTTGFFPAWLTASYVDFYRRWDINRPMDAYSIRLRPTVWYSEGDGLQPGFVADGGYTYNRYNAKAGLYYNIRSRRVDYDLRYNSRLDLLGKLANYSLLATNADGVQRWRAEISKGIPPRLAGESSAPTHRFSLGIEREVLVGTNKPNALEPWRGGGYNTIGLGYDYAERIDYGTLKLKGSALLETSWGSEQEFVQWRLGGDIDWKFRPLNLRTEIFLAGSSGDPPEQRLYNASGATSRGGHLNELYRLAAGISPDFGARNHFVLPSEGYLFSLVDTDSSARRGKNLLNMRVSIGDLNPIGSRAPLPVIRDTEIRLYAAAGWLLPGVLAADNFREVTVEAGVSASVDLFDALLPKSLSDAIDPPTPVRLSFFVPFYAHGPAVGLDGFAWRWAIGISL